MQSAQKEELSLDQAVNLGNRESREFRVIRFGSSIIMQIPRNSHHFSYLLQDKECIEQERESRKFRIIHFGSSLIMRILRNSHQFLCFLWTQLRIETRELKFARFAYCIYLTVCTTEVRDKVIRSKSVSVAIDRK